MNYLRQIPFDASARTITTAVGYYTLTKKGDTMRRYNPIGHFIVYGTGAMVIGLLWPISVPVLIIDACLD